MAKFYGVVGFLETVETDPENHPGVFEETYIDHECFGDVLEYSSRWENASQLNDDIKVTNPDHVCKGVKSMSVDGKAVDGNVIPVIGDGATHTVEVVLG